MQIFTAVSCCLLTLSPFSTGSRLLKRATEGDSSYASASSSSSGTIPVGNVDLSNSASASYSTDNQWSASSYGSNSAKGPNAVISSSAQAQVNTVDMLYGNIFGGGSGQSSGQVVTGTLSNNDNGNVNLGTNYINANGYSQISGSGTQPALQSIAIAGVAPKSQKKADSAYVVSQANSNGSVPTGDLNLNNGANSQYNNGFCCFIPLDVTATTVQTTSVFTKPPIDPSFTNPTMNANANSVNQASGTNAVINSVAGAQGATGLFFSQPGANANAANSGSAETGTLTDSHSANVYVSPNNYYNLANSNGNANIIGSGSNVIANSGAVASINTKKIRRRAEKKVLKVAANSPSNVRKVAVRRNKLE
jgi:hypothetical protein